MHAAGDPGRMRPALARARTTSPAGAGGVRRRFMVARMWRASSRASACSAAATAADLSSALSSLYLASARVRRGRCGPIRWFAKRGCIALQKKAIGCARTEGSRGGTLLPAPPRGGVRTSSRGRRGGAGAAATDGRQAAALPRGAQLLHGAAASLAGALSTPSRPVCTRRRSVGRGYARRGVTTRFAPPRWQGLGQLRSVRKIFGQPCREIVRWHRCRAGGVLCSSCRRVGPLITSPRIGTRDERIAASAAGHLHARGSSLPRSSPLAAACSHPRVALHGCCCARRPPAARERLA